MRQPGFCQLPNARELIIEFTLQTAEQVWVVFVIGFSSSKITLQHQKRQVAFVLLSISAFQGSSMKVNSHFLQEVLPWILLGPAMLDLLLDGFDALNGLDLDLVHQLQPNNLQRCFSKYWGKQTEKEGNSCLVVVVVVGGGGGDIILVMQNCLGFTFAPLAESRV